MRRIVAFSLAFALATSCLPHAPPAIAQIGIGISVDVEPPPLPVYVQPPIPADGYVWVPGYWAWSDDVGYYWVPGTWVLPPQDDLLWTPGYWGWNDGVYIFHAGYWGPVVGFYGGIAYGCGYTGFGYEGGYWRDHHFFYNRTVNNITNVSITNVYNKTVINNTINVSYNGGARGTTAKPTPEQVAAAKEHHIEATAAQTRHADAARHDPTLQLTNNHGHPLVAATSRAGQFKGAGIVASRPGKPVFAPPPKHDATAARINTGRNDASHALPVPPQQPNKSAAAIANHAQAAPLAKPQPAIRTASAPANHAPPARPQMARRPPPPPAVHAPRPQPVHLARPAPPPRRVAAPPPRPHPAPVRMARAAPPPRPHPAPQRHR